MSAAIGVVCLLPLFLTDAPFGVSSQEIDDYISRLRSAEKACGPQALCYCLGRMGKPVPIQEIMAYVSLDERGMTLKELVETCRKFEPACRSYKCDLKAISRMPTPAILAISRRHCVVLDSVNRTADTVTIYDPTFSRTLVVPMRDFAQTWSGEAILFQEPDLSWLEFGVVAVLGGAGAILIALAAGALFCPKSKS
jgi:ABC-type bacteriocin/lantibiotic exporter with double-glycine peptidase domain